MEALIDHLIELSLKNISDLVEEGHEALVVGDFFGGLHHSGRLLLSVSSIGETPVENFLFAFEFIHLG